MSFRFLRGLAACLLLLASFACVDALTSGTTSGVTLYAYDDSTHSVMAWNDLDALYTSTTTPSPDRTITSSIITSQIGTLAWGGLCLDATRGVLYLVSSSGNIVRISSIREKSGALSDSSTDVVSFALSTTGRLTGGVFGQASIDAQTDTLYVSENGDNSTQIWVIPGASTQPQNASVSLQSLQVSGDTGGTGVAAGQGFVYGFFLSGNPVSQTGSDTLTGARLRKGSSATFDPNAVILGGLTGLGQYGSLALDTGNGYLYVARHNTDSSGTGAPVGVFTVGQFNLGNNQAPTYTVGTAADEPDLRVIAHPGNKDWLVGLAGQGSTAYPKLYIWKSPLGGTAAETLTVSPSTTLFKGVALDGNAA